FGRYLEDQFKLVIEIGRAFNITFKIHLETKVDDVKPGLDDNLWSIHTNTREIIVCNTVIICTGHVWSRVHEGTIPDYFESPYPPSKLTREFDHEVCIRGSSLTAVDAVKTLARNNGHFSADKHGKLSFHMAPETPNFKIILYSI